MSGNVNLAWLDDASLAQLAGAGATDRSLWAQRYDPTCPSEFYRGYATLLSQVNAAFRPGAGTGPLSGLIDAYDAAIKALPADERRNGAGFALMNVASYAQAGTPAQISATLVAEIVCIARCFVQNRARGL